MAAYILSWAQAFEAGLTACGGKGYNLARLARYGFAVPDGGVIVSDVYRDLMQQPDLAVLVQANAGLQADDVTTVAAEEQLAQVRQAVVTAALPPQVRTALAHFLGAQELDTRAIAVRSSAVSEDGPHASFAGMHTSVLQARGFETVCQAILTCFASLWTPQAVVYRRRMAFADADVLCAVVLCAMVTAPDEEEPRSAGVAFSCDPGTGRRDLIVINAAPGLGDKVVTGTVEPDQIAMRHVRGEWHVHSRTTPATPVLTPTQERELTHHVWRIHWALGDGEQPQDVEWAYDGQQFWMLQARPVTRVPRATFAAIQHLPVIWSTANIKDSMPGVVSMFAWSMLQEIVDGILYAAASQAGYSIPPGIQSIKRHDGHAYFDMTAMQWCFYDSLGIMPARMVTALGGHQPEIPVPPGDPLQGPAGKPRRQAQRRLGVVLLTFRRRFRRALRAHFAAVRAIAALPWAQVSDAQLLEAIQRLTALHQRVDPLIGLANSYAGVFIESLDKQLRHLAAERAPVLLSGLLAGSGALTSAEQGYRIADLARVASGDPEALHWLQQQAPTQSWDQLPAHSPFRHALQHFLDDFGHRAVYETDIMNPRWRDDPTYLLEQVRRLLDTPQQADRRQAARQVRDAAWTELKRLTFWRRPVLHWLVHQVQAGQAAREAAKSGAVASVWPTRYLLLELGRRLVAAGHLEHPEDVFHLSKADVLTMLHGFWQGHGAHALTHDRATQRQVWLTCTPPDVLIEGEGGATSIATPAPLAAFDGQVWHGIAVSSGCVTAVARLMRHPHEGARLGHGDILVVPSTDPGWTPLFLRASAVVMETGGYLSHGAIVAREYGLPAVVNIPGILDQLNDGELLTVDGDTATVRRTAAPDKT